MSIFFYMIKTILHLRLHLLYIRKHPSRTVHLHHILTYQHSSNKKCAYSGRFQFGRVLVERKYQPTIKSLKKEFWDNMDYLRKMLSIGNPILKQLSIFALKRSRENSVRERSQRESFKTKFTIIVDQS